MRSSGSVKERHIEALIGDYLKISKIFFFKCPMSGYFDTKPTWGLPRFRPHASPYVRNGTPDLIAVINGQFIGFEVKSKGGKQSDAQKSFQIDVKAAGGMYFLVKSLEDVQKALSSLGLCKSIYPEALS